MLKKVLKENMNFDLDLFTSIDFRLLKGSPKKLRSFKTSNTAVTFFICVLLNFSSAVIIIFASIFIF